MTLYEFSVPAFAKGLRAMSEILAKVEAECAERKIDPSVILADRLTPDMFTFTRQIQMATDHARYGAGRLAGAETPAAPDTEASFAELRARIASALAFLQTVDPAAFAGAETRTIAFKAGPYALSFNGLDYLRNFALPNFWFHLTTAYAILRHNGFKVGKMDFLGG